MGCEEAGGVAEAGCQVFAIANLEDGIGETLEPVCSVLPFAFEVGCKVANEEHKWSTFVKNAACKKAQLC